MSTIAETDHRTAEPVAHLIRSGDAEPAPNRLGCLTLFELGSSQRLLPGCSPSSTPMLAALLGDEAMVVEQHGVSLSLRAGDWTLYSPSRAARLAAPRRGRVIFFPKESFGEATNDIGCALLSQFSRDRPINRITYSVLSALYGGASGITPGCAQELARATIHVLKNAIGDQAGQRRRCKTSLLQRAKEYVEWRLRDPDLSVSQLAKELNCSERSIHRAFEAQGETIGRYLLRVRLERCRDDLMARTTAERSVTETAFSYGFNNLAHFSRVYKEQFGHSPRATRA